LNTLIPRLFEKIAVVSPEFSLESVRLRLSNDPDRYIHEPLRHGLDLELPEEIAVGLEDTARLQDWNATAPTRYGQPTETWREVVTRRQHYAELRRRLAEREVSDIADLVTLNINLHRLAEDLIEGCDSSELLLHIYKVL
jgi:hypothetical protein